MFMANVKKIIVAKIVPKNVSTKHVKKSIKHVKDSIKHVKELKQHVKSLSSQMRKRETNLHKQMQEQKQQMQQMQLDVGETKQHYQHIPKLSMETQMLIESMNKLSGVVKQLLVLFNQKISNEEGPLFSKLDDIAEQNEKIAEGILAIASLVKEQQTPKAQIREFNPYVPRAGPQPLQVREQMPTPQEMPQVPSDLGRFQYPMETGQEAMQQQPIPQFGAPMPPFSPAPQEQEQLPSRKRMLF